MKTLFPVTTFSIISLSSIYIYQKLKKKPERHVYEKLEKIETSVTRHFATNEDLIASLDISDPIVMEVMSRVERQFYMKDNVRPYVDHAMPVGFGEVCMKPSLVAFSLESVFDSLPRDGVVLNVGCGSGYVSACFDEYLDDNGIVYAVDTIPGLIAMAERGFEKEGRSANKVQFICGDVFFLGIEDMGPFDCIYVGGSTTRVPELFTDNLKDGGSLITGIGKETHFQRLVVIKKQNKELLEQEICQVRLHELISNALTAEDENWTFHRNLDSNGNDLGHFPELDEEQLKKKCIELGGIAFNSSGWIKNSLTKKSKWRTFGGANAGLYVRTGHNII